MKGGERVSEFKASWWRPITDWDKAFHSEYPSEGLIATRSGFKVAWLLYDSEATAMACSPIAYKQGLIRAAQGYDFGYQSPGFVRQVEDGWEVVIP